MFTPRTWKYLALCVFGAVVLSGCGSLGSPVSITNRPLNDQIEDRNAERVSTTVPETGDAGATNTPEAIAFSDALANGNFLRLDVDTNGVDTTLRTGPGTSYDELTTLADGVEVLATGDQTGEWVFVVYGDLEGWVSNRRLVFGNGTAERPEVVEAEDIEESFVVYEVYGDVVGVNIRSAASPKASLVTGASVGSQVVGTGRTDGSWIEVTFNGITGWSSGNYLRPIGSQTGSNG